MDLRLFLSVLNYWDVGLTPQNIWIGNKRFLMDTGHYDTMTLDTGHWTLDTMVCRGVQLNPVNVSPQNISPSLSQCHHSQSPSPSHAWCLSQHLYYNVWHEEFKNCGQF